MEGAFGVGGNMFGFYSATLGTETERRIKIERALGQALESDEFELFYQPQVEARSLRDGMSAFRKRPSARFVRVVGHGNEGERLEQHHRGRDPVAAARLSSRLLTGSPAPVR